MDDPVQFVKLSSRGLVGHDRREFLEKRAAAPIFADKLASLQLKPGDVPIHVIAVGATEGYGENRNGDAFSEATCKKAHETFVKHARFYRNHKNKDPKKSFGKVALSAYNDRMRRIELLILGNGTKEAAERNGGLVMRSELQEKLDSRDPIAVSMACVADPTYPVLTRDRGYVEIQHVVPGDFVWTHEGRWQRVKQLNRRRYTGELRKFFLSGLSMPLELTADHPMWSEVFSASLQSVGAVKREATRDFRDLEEFDRLPAGWNCASHLNPGDLFFVQPVTRYSGYGAIDCQDLATLLGCYLAGGGFDSDGSPTCAMRIRSGADREITRILERIRPEATVTVRPHRESGNALVVTVHSTEIAEIFRGYIGVGSKKRIPPEIFNASREVKLAFLGAWLDCAGWLDEQGTHWSTANRFLALQGRDLLLSLGIPADVGQTQSETSGVEYTLDIEHLDSWSLSGYSAKAAQHTLPEKGLRKKPASLRRCSDGRYAVRIRRVESRHVEDLQTYNIEVEEDESYSLGGLISHNCRVAYDVCSNCGNKAANRRQYCTADTCISKAGKRMFGCKDGLTKVAADGTVQYVENPNPLFFDISEVIRPADRTAYGGRADYIKAASADGRVPGGAELAEWWAKQGADFDGLDPVQAIFPDAGRAVLRRKLARVLADMERRFEEEGSDLRVKSAGTARAYRTFLDVEGWDLSPLVGTREKRAEALYALAKHRVLLPLPAFLEVLTGESGEKTATLSVSVARHLPGVFGRLVSDPQGETHLRDEAFDCGTKCAASADRWAACASARFSLDTAPVRERLWQSALHPSTAPSLAGRGDRIKAAAAAGPEEQLARQYAAYQLSFLTSQAPMRPASFRDLCERVVTHNYLSR